MTEKVDPIKGKDKKEVNSETPMDDVDREQLMKYVSGVASLLLLDTWRLSIGEENSFEDTHAEIQYNPDGTREAII